MPKKKGFIKKRFIRRSYLWIKLFEIVSVLMLIRNHRRLLILGVGIAILYVRYLRRCKRTPSHERTSIDTDGLLIYFGMIAIVIGLSGITFLFYVYPDISTIIVFLLSLLLFTALFVFSARRSYKKSFGKFTFENRFLLLSTVYLHSLI